jgi:hypothetical protein
MAAGRRGCSDLEGRGRKVEGRERERVCWTKGKKLRSGLGACAGVFDGGVNEANLPLIYL